ncbi:hypothetical protein STEG23_020066, partial [Scotinomys teguina]
HLLTGGIKLSFPDLSGHCLFVDILKHRITHYQAMLLNPERIWFGTVTSLNRTTLLPEGGAEAVVEHNFLVGLMAEED